MKETVINNKTKSKIKKKLANLELDSSGKKREKNKVNKIGKEKGEATTDKA